LVADHFDTLVAKVKAGGLVDTLKGPGPLTVFAPTDDAFAKLQDILKYHVIAGKYMAADLAKWAPHQPFESLSTRTITAGDDSVN